MAKSEQINELAKALAIVQGCIEGASKDSTNPHFKSKYADLRSVWNAIREPLAANGLAIVQTAVTAPEGQTGIQTTLMHTSGQWIDGIMYLPSRKKDDPQQYGSAITYARRYSLAAMVGVYQEDDDAQAQPAPRPVDPMDALKAELWGLVNKDMPTLEKLAQDTFGIGAKELNEAQMKTLIKELKA